MGNPSQVDMAGLTLVANSLHLGATRPGTTGTALDTGGTITATIVGDVTGNLTGDVTGDVTGNVTGNVTGDVTGSVNANGGTTRIAQAVDNVHDTTPTAASIVTALGAAARGKIGTIDDADGDTNGYLCFATDASWYFLKFTKAS